MNWPAIRKALHNWVVAGSGLSPDKVIWTRQPGTPRPPAPAIMLEIASSNDNDYSWLDIESATYTFADLAVDMVSNNDLVVPNHGLMSGVGPVHITSTVSLPSPLTEDTNYWIIRVDENTIQLASSFQDTGGGYPGNPVTPIELQNIGDGLFTIKCTPNTMWPGQELKYIQRGMPRFTLTLTSHTAKDVGLNTCMELLQKVVSRARLPSQVAILDSINFGFMGAARVRSMLGTRDATLFEPRAWVDVQFSTAYEEFEYGTIIEQVSVTQSDD